MFSAASVKINQTEFDQDTPGEHFDGAYGSLSKLIPRAVVEPYFFWRMETTSKAKAASWGG